MSLRHEHACDCGARAAEDLLRSGFRIDVSKALDPLDPDDFVKITARLSRAMARATERTEAELLRKALQNLDVDWPRLSAAQRARVIEAARGTVAKIGPRVIRPIQQELRLEGERVVRGARRGERGRLSATLRTRIHADLQTGDKRVIKHLRQSQAHFVRDEYGRRVELYSRQARGIVAEALEEGLGREEIAELLQSRLGVKAGLAKSRNYWTVVSGTYINRSRTYGQLASYEEAGIERYVFEAVLDERTTDICAGLHGRTFETSKGLDLYRRVAQSEDPEAVKDIQPWVRTGKDAEGRQVLFTQTRDGARHFVAEVVQSRVGRRDELPVLRGMRSNDQLAEMGLVTPPLHGRCRSTIVADV